MKCRHVWTDWHPSDVLVNTNVRICLVYPCEAVEYDNPPEWVGDLEDYNKQKRNSSGLRQEGQ